ncbi:MAG: PBP1A family penicillin-binding protein [Gemmatimonadetes bacterium]|nr:PBP1A family penicillin-binding protein [Gemmatimonadota bacterium]
MSNGRLNPSSGFKATLPKLLLFAGALFLFGAIGGGWGAWQNLCVDCPSIAQISTWEPEETSKILSHDGRLVAEIGLERRTPVALEDLPEHVKHAFVALEDRRFYSHRGFDIRGILRSAFRAVVNRSFSGGGGSTISQQLARNMFEERIGREKRIARKLKELQVALALEGTYSKDQILEAYINQINYDRGWYGIQTASRNYFGKNASELNPAEAAMLAAIPNRPAYYNPIRNPENALRRRNLALGLMVDQGFLTEDEGQEWKAYPLPESQAEPREGLAPYFQEWVRKTLDDRFGSQLYTGGFTVHTTLDLDIQAAAELSMEEGWAYIEGLPGFDHPLYEDYAEQTDPFEEGETPYLQGVLIALDPHTGGVRAMVGGRDFRHSKFNRATQALRQAGSSFKPFVYTAALASGIPASHILVDAPVVLPQVSGEEWKPQNFTEEFLGPITIREGLRRSINMIAIKLGLEVGLETVAQTAQMMGLRTEIERFPSTSIGAAEIIPIQMAEAYATFATLGTRVRPQPILKVLNREGDVLWEPEPDKAQVLDSLTARIMVSMLEDVVARGTGYNVRDPGRGALTYDVPAAGKTGTTNDATNVWFQGFTPNLMATIWFGMDRPVTIWEGATGGGFGAPVWGRFMHRVYVGDSTQAHADSVFRARYLSEDSTSGGALLEADSTGDQRPEEVLGRGYLLPIPDPWPVLPGLVTKQVDNRSGLLASRWCPADSAYAELFLPGTEPTEFCDMTGFRIRRNPAPEEKDR